MCKSCRLFQTTKYQEASELEEYEASELEERKGQQAFMIKGSSDCLKLTRIPKKNSMSVLTAFCRWRLGNQMSAFATGYALWRTFGVRNFIVGDHYEKLSEVFHLPVPKQNYVSGWPYHVWTESK